MKIILQSIKQDNLDSLIQDFMQFISHNHNMDWNDVIDLNVESELTSYMIQKYKASEISFLKHNYIDYTMITFDDQKAYIWFLLQFPIDHNKINYHIE
jgi:hypothetical protein